MARTRRRLSAGAGSGTLRCGSANLPVSRRRPLKIQGKDVRQQDELTFDFSTNLLSRRYDGAPSDIGVRPQVASGTGMSQPSLTDSAVTDAALLAARDAAVACDLAPAARTRRRRGRRRGVSQRTAVGRDRRAPGGCLPIRVLQLAEGPDARQLRRLARAAAARAISDPAAGRPCASRSRSGCRCTSCAPR